ncbi:membrane protein insertase YidC [Estrella lausannensis]|uniref:Membrane protein insertase YidC n=1 Tax=Estrella lausannensis TaxID=483423 RepID=A0A0H5DSH7_9BACT|nr:membrane protein insertase YidC [Estrella lausannensis]CRX39253.1 Inner membrane protein oxaA [Estrella lausannensis]
MDKRTLIFAVSLSLTLFVVNMFFDWQGQEQREAWLQQQKAIKTKTIEKLKTDIAASKKAMPALPIVDLHYVTQEGTEKLTALEEGSNVIFLKPEGFEAKDIYTEKDGVKTHYSPLFVPEKVSHPTVFSKKPSSPLKVAEYNEFGHYDLVLLIPDKEGSGFAIYNAEMNDGSFSVPLQKLDTLSKETEGDEYTPKFKEGPGIVLAKTDNRLLPLAYFRGTNQPLDFFEDAEEFAKDVVKERNVESTGSAVQSFYTLENETVQLVISTIGGAATEINLPFQSETNTRSVVMPIEFDRDILKDHTANARFPLKPAYSYKDGKAVLEEGQTGGYYPLLRRDLIQKGRKIHQIAHKYYAFNLVSEYPEIAELPYTVKHYDGETLVLESKQDRRKITKTFALAKKDAPYCFTLKIDVQGDARGLWLTSGVPEAELVSGSPAPSLQYRLTKAGKPEVNQIDLPKDAINISTVAPDWVSNSNAFFGIILDPLKSNESGFKALYVSGKDAPSRLTLIGEDWERFKSADLPGYMTLLPLNQQGGSMEFRFFTGPYSTPVLKEVDAAFSDPTTGYNPDYLACQTFHGWFAFISEPFAKFLFFLMNAFHSFTGSWAISIVLLTVALRIMLYPLNAWSTKSMLKMQQIAPKVQEIQQKYKNDQKKAQIEIMELYKESGANPFSGCLPLLVQMPFLIGMFDLLKSSFQLRGASFIPGWIDNLTSPDVLFSWSFPIPLIGNEFHLLPVILGAIMLIQPMVTSNLPKDKKLWTEQQRQQKAMGTMMAVLFTWMFYNFPSGLNIYWISSMLLGMAQQIWTQKTMKPVAFVENAPKKKK